MGGSMNEKQNEQMTSILWRRFRYFLTPQFDLYRNIAPHLAGKTVLEVGFGTGFGTVQLAQYGDIYAFEPDLQAVEFARMVLPHPCIHWHSGDITAMLVSSYYDAAVMVETLEHIEDWRKALANIHKALKPGGCLYMTARNRNADLRRNDLHEREWTAQELLNALGEFFLDVKLYDYTLTNELTADTHITPLIAVARKAGGQDETENLGGHTGAGRVEGRAEQTYTAAVWKTAYRVDDRGSAKE